MTNAILWPRLAIAATALVLFGGCGDGPDKNGEAGPSVADPSTETTTCETTDTAAAPAAVPSELPESLRPPAADTVQRADVRAGGKTVVLVVSSPAEVDDVYGRYKAALPAAGFTIDREDNEGREAELYFARNGQKGSLLIKMSSCPPGSTAYQLTVPTA